MQILLNNFFKEIKFIKFFKTAKIKKQTPHFFKIHVHNCLEWFNKYSQNKNKNVCLHNELLPNQRASQQWFSF